MSGRPWTETEDAEVRRCYGKEPAATIAARLNRSVKSIQQRGIGFGLQRRYRGRMPALVDFVRRRYAEGWSDAEIASAWQCDRHCVGSVRRRLGFLPNRAISEHYRQRVREKTAEQLRRAGLPSLGQVRVAAFQKYARDCGWPEDLRPRAVQILNALRSGPKTRRQLCAIIGMRWRGSRASLTSNDPEGSYLAHLIRRGLVISLGKICKGQGRGRSTQLYSLALEARHGRGVEGAKESTETAGSSGQRNDRLDGGAAPKSVRRHHGSRHDGHHEGAR